MRCFFISLLVLMSVNSLAKKKKILVINSYHKGFEWVDDYTRAIQDTLGQNYQIVSIDMNTKRIAKSEFNKAKKNALNEYLKQKPDLVFLCDDNALSLLGVKLLKENAKIVFLGINNNPRKYFSNNQLFKMHGVLEQPLIRRSISFLKEIMRKNLKKAVLQYDTCKSSEYVINNNFHGDKIIVQGEVDTHLKQVITYEQWQNGIISAASQGYNALFAGFYYCLFDKNKNHVDHDKIIKWSAKNSNLPIFAFWDFAVGKDKAIGGYVISGYEMGKQASLIAKDVLIGKMITGSKRILSLNKGKFLFSKSQLKKWNIVLPKHIKANATLID